MHRLLLAAVLSACAIHFAPTTALATQLLLYDNDGEKHGCLNCNSFSSDSVCNQFGEFGSEFRTESIWNQFGTGSEFDSESPWNILWARIEGRRQRWRLLRSVHRKQICE